MPIQARFVDLGDYLNDDGWLDAEQLAERIDELKERRDEFESEGAEPDEGDVNELRLLLAFYGDVKRTFDRFADGYLTMAPEEEFERLARREAEEEYGLGADVDLSDFVDWAGYAKARKALFSRFTLDGQGVLVRDDS